MKFCGGRLLLALIPFFVFLSHPNGAPPTTPAHEQEALQEHRPQQANLPSRHQANQHKLYTATSMDQPGLEMHHQQNNHRSTADITMTERAHEQLADATTAVSGTTTESTSSALSKEPESKKPPGSGPVSITMDVYHQLQQKRLLERQQQESLKQQQQQQQPQQPQAQDKANHFSQDGQSANFYEQQQQGTQPSLETLEQIVSIVQATAPALPIVSTQTHQLPMPGPDLANIIFGTTPAATASVGTNAESDNAAGSAKVATTVTSNGHSGTASNSHQHRKGAGGASGSQMQSQSQQPRTSSPPTPASGSSSGAQKTPAVKGPKAIHAIELIRIAGEILQL